MLSLAGLAIVLFASTNLDDIVVLLAFFADPRFRLGQIVLGQYLGLAALVLVSAVASLVSLVLAPDHVGLLGLLPVLIGFERLWDLLRADREREETRKPAGARAILSVALATLANGGDNIAVYTPVFATRSAVEIAAFAAIFAVLTAAWLIMAHGLVNHPRLGAPFRSYGPVAVPFVLIGLGIEIMRSAGSFGLLTSLAGWR